MKKEKLFFNIINLFLGCFSAISLQCREPEYVEPVRLVDQHYYEYQHTLEAHHYEEVKKHHESSNTEHNDTFYIERDGYLIPFEHPATPPPVKKFPLGVNHGIYLPKISPLAIAYEPTYENPEIDDLFEDSFDEGVGKSPQIAARKINYHEKQSKGKFNHQKHPLFKIHSAHPKVFIPPTAEEEDEGAATPNTSSPSTWRRFTSLLHLNKQDQSKDQ